ncbi:MAG: phage tail sheath family protein [Chloroflexi bacterium]|nr:phage tail sheath family protein [Chloroflexota bacterium]
MPVNYLAPDIYIEEVPLGTRPIQAVGTSTAGFVGAAPDKAAHLNEAVAIPNWTEFVRQFVPNGSASTALSHAVRGFFDNGGTLCYIVNTGDGPIIGGGTERVGLDVLATIDEVAIVAAPGQFGADVYDALLTHCENLHDRVCILDTPANVTDLNQLTQVATASATPTKKKSGDADSGDTPAAAASTGLRPRQSDNGFGAVYFPWITVRDALSGAIVDVAPSGHIAGIWARTDATRGVHKAPANEIIRGALNVTRRLTRDEQGILNPQGVNAIRLFSGEGVRVMGARTVAAASSEYRYLNVRRLFCMVEESIDESMRWVLFEPNNIPLWKSIERDVTAFLIRLWRDGALQGATQQDAFFVKCDAETNPQENIDAGIVTTIIGMAPVKPAEFVVFRISQFVGGTEVEALGGGK